MNIVFINQKLSRKSLPVTMLSSAMMLMPIIVPDRAVGQTRMEPPAASMSSALDERPSKLAAQGESDGLKVFALRLGPGMDLRRELERFTKERGLSAGFIITAVGSLKKTALRLANQSDATNFDGQFEIVSLVGTLSQDGVHLHLSLADGTGKTIGGHLVEGCMIYTTVEVIIGDARGVIFTREADKMTGYKELRIRRNSRQRRR